MRLSISSPANPIPLPWPVSTAAHASLPNRSNLSVLLVPQGQQWLFEDSPDVGVGGLALEVGGSKLGEPVLLEVLLHLRHGDGGQGWGGRGNCV